MKFAPYFSLLALPTVFASILVPQPALSKECPYDSYMIVNGRCHDLTPKNTPTVHQTVYLDNPDSEKIEAAPQIAPKKCSDFQSQASAQFYFDRHPENKNMDLDYDGYACNHLTRSDGNILTAQIWQELLNENIARKRATKNAKSLTRGEVFRIIGFSPNASRGSREIWEDPINKMAIKIRFHRGRIVDMKGVGF